MDMNETKIQETHLNKLRWMAERRVGTSSADASEGNELLRLVHELEVTQVELEMQNEELRGTRDAIEQAKTKYEHLYRNYAALFNFAPIGYLTIDRDGVISDINIAAAIMLKGPRSSLVKRRITDFIHGEDQDGFYYHKLACQREEDVKTFEIRMKQVDCGLFDARLQMQLISPGFGDEQQYSIALMDVSEHVELSSNFALQQACLEAAATVSDMASLLQTYVGLVKDYLKCDAVGIRLRDHGANIPYQAYDGFSQAFYASESPLSLPTYGCMCAAVIRKTTDPKLPYFTPNGSFYVNGTGRFLATAPPEDPGKMCNLCNDQGYESVALIPITIDATVEGLIHVADRRENAFPRRLVEALESVGMRLGLAIRQLRLQERLRETVGLLRHLSSHLLTAQEDEQQRIAMELHDGCGQDLNVLKLRLKGLQNSLPSDAGDLRQTCSHLLGYMDKIINDVRDLAHGLKPAALDTLGLATAARQVIRELSANSGIQVEMDLALLDRIERPEAQVCLFRILQEAMTNIIKHAQATRVSVSAVENNRHLQVCIRDNGVGFDFRPRNGLNGSGRGMGLSAMTLRSQMIGATISIESAPGKGTNLTVNVPRAMPGDDP